MLNVLLLKDPAAVSFSKKEKILYYLLAIFFLSLYAPVITWVYNAGMWMFVAYCLVFNSVQEKKVIFKERKLLLAIILFFLFSCISAALSVNKAEGLAIIGYRLNLLAVPLSLGTICISQKLKQRIINAFAFATTAGVLFCLLWSIFQALKYNDFSLLYNDNLSFIINFQSVYLAMLVNLAVFSYVYLLVKNDTLVNKLLLVPAFFILLIVNFLLASRISIVLLYGSILVFVVFYIIRGKKILEGVTLVMGLLLGCFLLIKFFPKTINRFSELTYTKFDFKSEGKESHFNMAVTSDQWNGANIRLAVWECTWALIEKHPVTGVGLGDKMDRLKEQYARQGFTFGYKTNRSVHNNYLDIWLSMGLLGLIVFLTGFFILPVINCLKLKDWYGLTIIFVLMIALFTETYTDRMIGNTMLAFFISFITAYKKDAVI